VKPSGPLIPVGYTESVEFVRCHNFVLLIVSCFWPG
jgi:hypothetical protein